MTLCVEVHDDIMARDFIPEASVVIRPCLVISFYSSLVGVNTSVDTVSVGATRAGPVNHICNETTAGGFMPLAVSMYSEESVW